LAGLGPGTTYYYKAKAVGDGTSYGGEMSFTTTEPDTTPPVISVVTATSITATGVTITWTTNEPATSQVECGTTTSYGSSSTLDSTLVTSHSVTLEGLSPGTTYHYKVKSKDALGNEAVSADSTFTTATDNTVPSKPAVADDGASTTSLTQLHAIWSSTDAESGIAEYQYTIGTASGGTDVVAWTSVGTNTQVTKTGLTLTAGMKYFVSVKA
jgi:phosphodiesterase/alkaline phosphatase D-like protein